MGKLVGTKTQSAIAKPVNTKELGTSIAYVLFAHVPQASRFRMSVRETLIRPYSYEDVNASQLHMATYLFVF